MARSTKRGESLAFNLALIMFMVVTISLTIVMAVSIAGVVDLAVRHASARQVAYQQALVAEMEARLDGTLGVMSRASAVLDRPKGEEPDRVALAMQFDAGAEFVDSMIVALPDGSVIAAYPTFQAPRDVSGTPNFEAAHADEPEFIYVPAAGELWVSRRLATPHGDNILMLRVRTAFLELLIKEFSSVAERRFAMITDTKGTAGIVSPRRPKVDFVRWSFEPENETDSGYIHARLYDGTHFVGRYSTLTGYRGIVWRVSVIEPRMAIFEETARALAPAALALLFGGLLSIFVSFVFVRRQVRPIKDLEARAREAVTGAHVQQIESDRADELGRMADAFDAIALRLNLLNHLCQLLASSSNLNQVLDGILVALRQILRSESVAVFILDETESKVVGVRSKGLSIPDDTVVEIPKVKWLVAATQAEGPISITGEEHLYPAGSSASSSIERLAFSIGMAVPLRAGDRLLGVVVIFESGRREFTAAEVEVLRTFSAQASIAVFNSRLFETESVLRQEAEALRELAGLLALPQALGYSVDAVNDTLGRLFGADSVRTFLIDPEKLGFARSDEPEVENLLLKVWESNKGSREDVSLIMIERGMDIDADRLLARLGHDQAWLLSAMRDGIPKVIVVLTFDSGNTISEERIYARASAVSNQLSLALENTYNLAAAKSHAANLETIFRISQAVSSSLQINVVLNRVLDVVQKIFTADAVALMKYDEARQKISTVMARGKISSKLLHFECTPGEGVFGQAFSAGVPLRIDCLGDCDDPAGLDDMTEELDSLLSVPLIARGRSIGLLTIFSTQCDTFSDEDMELLHTFASQAAIAIDTASLYSKEHHVSSVLQSGILPQRLPDYPEILSAYIYLPSGKDAEIGGDYYDLFKDSQGRVVFVIGDVCGKGIEAATKTSMIKYSVRALIAAGLDPHEALKEINRLIAETGATSDIVTLWIGVLEPETGLLRYANGGHPPALLWRPGSRKSERLCTTGPLLGAFTDVDYEEMRSHLLAGDMILLYTDGVTEARNGNKFFGEGRVRRALSRGLTPVEVANELLAALDEFVPGDLRDDAAVLVVQLNDWKLYRASDSDESAK